MRRGRARIAAAIVLLVSLDDADIDVEVKDGVVRLAGSVPSESDRIAASVLARATPGVRSVLSDDLRVKQQG